MVNKYLLIPFLLFLSLFKVTAQDIHLTQYYFSPLNLNPAYTGRFDGDFRIVGNHRSQWGAIMEDQFITSSISYEQVIKIYTHELSLGGVFVHDQSGPASLDQNKFQISAGYNRKYKGNFLSAGIQTGLLHRGIDYSELTFPTQFDNNNGEFNNSLDNGQSFIRNNDYSFDFNFGLGWSRQVTEDFYPEVGLSFFHLNTPRETFLDNRDEQMPIRNILDIKLNYRINDKWVVTPTIMHQRQKKASELLFGGLVKNKLEENKYQLTEIFAGTSVRAGFGRNYDAVALIVGGKIQEFQVGLSYDFNVSELSSLTHYQGAFEISVIYIAKSTQPKIFNVPCDRF
jgi:type IX secretion system PorP/SprF family membrane protein